MRQVFKKIYCYVDETGQDTLGRFFLVSVVVKDIHEIEDLGHRIEKLEKISGKNLTKWTHADFTKKLTFLKLLLELKGLKNAIYYSVYENSTIYLPLVAMSVAKAVVAQKDENCIAKIIIDGISKTDALKVKKELKKLSIHYKDVRGMKDEQNVFLRVADTFAGFLRDSLENKEYAKSLKKKFFDRGIVQEI